MTTQYTTEVNNMINETEANIMQVIENEDFRSAVAETAKAMGVPADLWNNDTTFRMAFYAYAANQII
jgi:hypothetical protein